MRRLFSAPVGWGPATETEQVGGERWRRQRRQVRGGSTTGFAIALKLDAPRGRAVGRADRDGR